MKKTANTLLKCAGAVGIVVLLAIEDPTVYSVLTGAVLTGLSGWVLARLGPDPEADRA